jgi:hypothetical protein
LPVQLENTCSNSAGDKDNDSASDSNDSTVVDLADLSSELDESLTLEEDVIDQDELVIQPPALSSQSTRGKK